MAARVLTFDSLPVICFLQGLQTLFDLASADNEEARIEQLLQEQHVMRSIAKRIVWHVPPPCVLGNGRTGLLAKLRVFVHTFGLLADSRPMLAQLLPSVVSLHTDYGTEVGLVRVLPSRLRQILPYMHASEPVVTFPVDDPDQFAPLQRGLRDESRDVDAVVLHNIATLQDDPEAFTAEVHDYFDLIAA